MSDGAKLLPAVLERWTTELLAAAGLEGEAAATVSRTLVDASLRGVDSHGVARTPIYLERLRAGGINPRPRPRVEREEGALALMHGDDGPGQVAGVAATDHSIELARRYGVGVVAVRRSNHYGAAGFYAVRAARAGLIGMSTTNSDPFVIPFGGRECRTGDAEPVTGVAAEPEVAAQGVGQLPRKGRRPGRGRMRHQGDQVGPFGVEPGQGCRMIALTPTADMHLEPCRAHRRQCAPVARGEREHRYFGARTLEHVGDRRHGQCRAAAFERVDGISDPHRATSPNRAR